MTILLPQNSKKPLYIQIYEQIKNEIQTGIYKSGMKLPSKRKLAHNLGTSVNTIDSAYSQLVSEGFIESKPQSGYYICEIEELIHATYSNIEPSQLEKKEENIVIDFSASRIDTFYFPYNTWRKLMKNCFDEYNDNLLQCSESQGDERLRSAIVEYLYQARGVKASVDRVVIGAGTDHLLQMLSYILENTCTIAMENPVYHKASDYFRRMGHYVFTLDVNEKGIPIEPLKQYEHIAVYITPSHQFPLGISMPISRRIKLLNWANSGAQRYIIEDDYDSEFRYNTKPIPSLQSIDYNEKVIYLGTFSKSIAPSLRISYMVLPKTLLNVYKDSFSMFSCAVSAFEQQVLTEFLYLGHFETHLNKMRKIYKEKRVYLVKQLNHWFHTSLDIIGDEAGHHLLVKLKTGLSEEAMCILAKKEGVKVYPISPYFAGKIPKCFYGNVLLGYGHLNEAEISEGVERLYYAWITNGKCEI